MNRFEQWRRDSLEEDLRRYYGLAPFEDSPNRHAQAALANMLRTYSTAHINAACARLLVPLLTN